MKASMAAPGFRQQHGQRIGKRESSAHASGTEGRLQLQYTRGGPLGGVQL
jgi:hypothetical protein